MNNPDVASCIEAALRALHDPIVLEKKAKSLYLHATGNKVPPPILPAPPEPTPPSRAFYQTVKRSLPPYEKRKPGRRRKSRRKEKHAVPPDVRAFVLERDSFRCTECGAQNNLHLHHVVHRANGGSEDADNLVTLCPRCHYEKHKDSPVGKLMKSSL